MKSAEATYFDGKVSTRRKVLLILEGQNVSVQGEGIDLSYPASGIRIPPGVGSIRRTVRFPDGGVCELEDAQLLASLERLGRGTGTGSILHRWEKSLPLAIGAVLLTALFVVLFLRYGVPALARSAAMALPPSTENSIGRESLSTLDRLLMKPSTLTKERRADLTALFQRVAGPAGVAAGYRLEFRSCPAIGANAFALPSGIVIVTDGLVDLARDNDELAAVLAHELGHVRGRHALRHVLQSSAAGLVVATLTGDLVSITSLAATLPTALVDASFSREFEREADDAAIAWMKSAGVPPRRYAEMLGRLEAQLSTRRGETTGGSVSVRNYLSTHPDTGERIREILKEERE